jgi:hypothetical protein
LAEEQVGRPQIEAADPLGPGEDEDELAASAPLLSRMNLAPVVAADGINQGADRGSDLLPSF